MKCYYEYEEHLDDGNVVGMCGLSNGDECTNTEREWCNLYWEKVKNEPNSCMRCKHVLTDYGPCAWHSMFYCQKHSGPIDPDDMPTLACEDFEE